MIWQDFLFTAGQLGFMLALIPSLRSKDKPTSLTSLIYGSLLLLFAVGFATLGLWFSCVSTLAVSAMWFVLLVQKRKRDKLEEK